MHPLSMSSTPVPSRVSGPAPSDLARWNRDLNRTHAMAGMRARAGVVVSGIEARRRRLVAACVRRLRPRVVVDVGCEDGWIAEAYADAAVRVVLCDLDPDVLAVSAVARRPNVRTVACDALTPAPLAAAVGPGGADVIVLSALLEHLPEPARALTALRSILQPGGRFVIYLPADGPILFAKSLLKRSGLGGLVRGLSLEPAPGHLHRFTRAGVGRLLQPFGEIERLAFDPLCLGYLAVVRSS